MAGIITTGNHPKAMWPGVKAFFGRQYDEHSEEFPDLFDMGTSDKAYEEYVELTGFGLAAVIDQGAPVQYDSESQGYITRITNVAYALGFIVTRQELDDNQYEIVGKRRAKVLAFSARQTKETILANIYNRAQTTGYTGGDGVVLLSTAHPTKNGTQANKMSSDADISEAALEDLSILIMNATNSRGMKINLIPQSLHVPPALWYEAHRILKSVQQNDTANNATNALKLLNVFPKGIKLNRYLSDTDAYFIRTNVPDGMVFQQRIPYEFTQDNDFDTMNAKAKYYERFAGGWGDWRALYGSMGG